MTTPEQPCEYCELGSKPYYQAGWWRHAGGVLCQRPRHVWNTPERAGGECPIGFPRCIYCGADYSQVDRACGRV